MIHIGQVKRSHEIAHNRLGIKPSLYKRIIIIQIYVDIVHILVIFNRILIITKINCCKTVT